MLQIRLTSYGLFHARHGELKEYVDEDGNIDVGVQANRGKALVQ